MASCPSCGRHPIHKAANGLRSCRHCGTLPNGILRLDRNGNPTMPGVAPKPAYGTPEYWAIYDAHRKVLGYPSRQELAAFDRRFPVYDPSSALRQDEVGAA